MFICTILQNILKKYDYTTMLSGDKLKKELIDLPVKKDKTIDWEYMEKYIENFYKELSVWTK